MPRASYSDSFFANDSFSNSYSKLITMNIDTDYITNNYTKRYALAHKLKGASLNAVNTFQTNDASIYMASTNSLFFTIMKSQAEPCIVSGGGGGGGGGFS